MSKYLVQCMPDRKKMYVYNSKHSILELPSKHTMYTADNLKKSVTVEDIAFGFKTFDRTDRIDKLATEITETFSNDEKDYFLVGEAIES